MVVLLNYLPLLLFILLVAFVALVPKRLDSTKKLKLYAFAGLLFVAGLFTYQAVQPSYLPKGVIARTQPPAFESKGEIKDVQPKPMSSEERDARRKAAFKEKLPFIENK